MKKCSVAGCNTKHYGRGFCAMHHARWQKGADLNAPKRHMHGLCKNRRLYHIWENVKQRCLNPRNTSYSYYGGRGIKLCEEWKSFETFYFWAVKAGYRESLTLERIDPNGNYEPSNCKWATRKEQMNNLRRTVIFEYRGERKSLQQWAAQLGIHPHTLRWRKQYGWSTARLLTTPADPRFRRRML